MLYKKIDIIVREMDIYQDIIQMNVGCDLAPSISQCKSAHSGATPVCGGPI